MFNAEDKKMRTTKLLRGLILLCLVPGNLFLEPFSTGMMIGVGAVGSLLWKSKETIMCAFKECCQEPYVRTNLVGFEEKLTENVFGQHIVLDVVAKTMKSHLRKKEHHKALALSFHGWTGSGKNYVAKFIAETLFKEGMKSKFVHHFYSSLHFPHKEESDLYKAQIREWISGNVTACARTLFIFDEIDKLPPGVIDAIKPYIDYHEQVNSVDFRKSIFLFLSNTGGEQIALKTYNHWKEGRKREDLSLADLEAAVNLGAYNEEGGLQKSDVIQKHLVDLFVPFLPLEKEHVKMCIRREFHRREEERKLNADKEDDIEDPAITYKDADVDALADKMVYWPEEFGIYSLTGCKKVVRLVDFFLEDEFYHG